MLRLQKLIFKMAVGSRCARVLLLISIFEAIISDFKVFKESETYLKIGTENVKRLKLAESVFVVKQTSCLFRLIAKPTRAKLIINSSPPMLIGKQALRYANHIMVALIFQQSGDVALLLSPKWVGRSATLDGKTSCLGASTQGAHVL